MKSQDQTSVILSVESTWTIIARPYLPIVEAEVARVIAAVLADSDMVLHFFVGPIVIGVGASMSKFLSWHEAAADLPGLAEEQ